MSKFKIGSVYTVGETGIERWYCLAVDNHMGWFKTKANPKLGIEFLYTSFGPSAGLVLSAPPEAWVAVFWTDNFKTNVEIGGLEYDSKDVVCSIFAKDRLFHSALRLR